MQIKVEIRPERAVPSKTRGGFSPQMICSSRKGRRGGVESRHARPNDNTELVLGVLQKPLNAALATILVGEQHDARRMDCGTAPAHQQRC